MTAFNESTVEQAALDWLSALGWQVLHGPDIAPGASGAERDDYRQPFLEQRLRDALGRLNPGLPAKALDDALRKLTQPEGATLEARNRAFHRLLVDGVTVEYRAGDGAIRGEQARVIDFKDPHGQRLAGGQPVHGHGESEHPSPRHRAVRQRTAPGRH